MNLSRETELLWKILRLPGVGAGTVRKIIAKNKLKDYNDFKFPSEILIAFNEAEKLRNNHGITVISPYDQDYPKLLKLIEDYPPLLFIKGNRSLLTQNSIAVVGTRHPSTYGTEVARRIAAYLVQNHYCVTSGLALGIDAAAHKGALEISGNTIAVLAHGLDTIAPKTNISIANEIISKGGLLLSEHDVGVNVKLMHIFHLYLLALGGVCTSNKYIAKDWRDTIKDQYQNIRK